MLSRIWNLASICLFLLLSSCFRSYEVSHLTDVDGGGPSGGGDSPSVGGGDPSVGGGDPSVGGSPSVGGGDPSVGGGDPSVGGGNPSVDVDKPIVDAGIEEASLLGAWRGRLLFTDNDNQVSILDDIGFEFTDTEVVVSFTGIELYRASYSVNRDVDFYQVDMKITSVSRHVAPQLAEADLASLNFQHSFPAIFKLENGQLTIAMSVWLSSPPRSLDPGVEAMTAVLELSRVR